jgi:hypothetical protein
VSRFGKHEDLKFLIRPGDRMAQLDSEWCEIYSGEAHPIVEQDGR